MKATLLCPKCNKIQTCISTDSTKQCTYCYHVGKREVSKKDFGDITNLKNLFGIK